MLYSIRQGNIAALIVCNEESFVHFKPNVLPGHYTSNDAAWQALPEQVQQAICAQFNEVFARPVEERNAFIKTLVPFDIMIAD